MTPTGAGADPPLGRSGPAWVRGDESSSPADPSPLLRPFSYSLGAVAFVSLAGLALNVVLTRLLAVEDMGHVRMVRTVLDLMLIPATLGMGACIAKHVADARATESERRRIFVTGATFVMGGGLAVAVVGFGLLHIPGILRDRVAVHLLRWMIFVLPFIAVFACVQGYLQGTGRIRRLACVQVGRSAAVLALGASLAAGYGLGGWAAGRATGEMTAAAIGAGLALALGGARPDFSLVRRFARFGAFIALTQAMTTLLAAIGVLCLDRFGGDAAVIGRYGIAILVFETTLLLPRAFIQTYFAPMAARGYDAERTWETMSRYTTRMMTMALPTAGLAYLAAPIIGIVFGPDYADSVRFFRWLAPAFVVISLGSVPANLIVSAGLVRANLLASLATLALNAVLNIALTPRWGVAGVVTATTFSHLLRTSLSFFILFHYRNAASRTGSG